MLRDPKTLIGSDFDQETAEKIAPQFIARLELANCRYTAPGYFFPPTWMFCRLSLLSSLLSRFASWSQKSPELLYKKKKSKIAKIPERTKTRMSQLQKCSQSISPE